MGLCLPLRSPFPAPPPDSDSCKPTAARVHKIAERFKGLATKLDDLNLVPGTFMVWKERVRFCKLFSDF